jgi:predicted transcriptional regulator
MKTAISLPDDVFERAEKLATRLNISRSQLYGRALREFVARHSPEEVTEALDRVCEAVDGRDDDFVLEASRRVVARSEW